MMAERDCLPFPYKYEELKPEEKAEIARLFKSPAVDYVGVGLRGYRVTKCYMEEAANIYNMELRTSDIVVASYQRSGTTWTQELVWLLANDLDYSAAAAMPLTLRYYFLEIFMFFNQKWKQGSIEMNKDPEVKKVSKEMEIISRPVTDALAAAPSPRFIKSHLPLSLLPPTLLDTAKVVYVARDPRDVAVSSYHHSRLIKFLDFSGTFKEFWNLFINDLMTLTPYFGNVIEAWEKRHHPNMLFLFYEELSKDLPASVRRVADFLGKDLSPGEMTRLCNHLHLDNFKKNAAVNFEEWRELDLLAPDETFIRRGKAGGWRDYFDEELSRQAECWMADNLRDTDLRFPEI